MNVADVRLGLDAAWFDLNNGDTYCIHHNKDGWIISKRVNEPITSARSKYDKLHCWSSLEDAQKCLMNLFIEISKG